ncbi:Inactive pancreatic lipase-related protein 1 [Trichoplax sp. H2]|nr:Inactive pancreatic lipase-related protein 1 [Trichoplax sp. H2]|eukprot:RDD46186.1 Inactive pancreatic lipase-related protein 1 [Trichoplax sp. H2]
MFKQLLVVAAVAAVALARPEPRSTMCDPDPKLGCYSDTGPWDRWFFPLPKPSNKIGTKFYLYTRGYSSSQTLDYNNPSSISGSRFNGNIDTKIIIHGFNSDSTSAWMHNMKNAFLNKGYFNVILVDWGGGAKTLDYDQASANTRVVGDMVGELAKALPTSKSRVHIIGHSLGAHTASFASVRLNKAGRVSGLDPADPNFQGQSTAARLDKTDADFVDVIHSDADTFLLGAGYGTKDASGHLDFWPNGGEDQPQCGLFKDVQKNMNGMSQRGDIGCDHGAAHTYYVESINSACDFVAKPCSSYSNYKSGSCASCFGNPCPIMGYRAVEFKNYYYYNYRLFLTTNKSAPYCSSAKSAKSVVEQLGGSELAAEDAKLKRME